MAVLVGVVIFLVVMALFGGRRDPLRGMPAKERFEFLLSISDEEYERLRRR